MRFARRNDGEEQELNRRTVLRNAIAVGSLAVGAAGTAAADNKPQKFSIDESGFEAYIPCLDETYRLVRGIQQFTIHQFEDGNGGYHLQFHTHYDPRQKAVGLETGNVYTGQNTKSFTKNVQPPYPTSATFISNTTATSKDTTVTVLFRINNHLTINAKGEVTNVRKSVEFLCK